MYSKVKFDTFYRAKVRELISSGQFCINEAGKLTPANPKGTLTTPWVFTNNDARRKFCVLWNAIYCGKFNLIPTFCRFNCWKTVIYPRNVFELFALSHILRSLDLPSKCGIDRRNYTHHAWGGYVYADSLPQGQKYYSRVRKAVSEIISPDVDVILKRGCTEMERLHPSNEWDDHTEEEKTLEFQLDDLFDMTEINFNQSAWLRRDIKEGWILRAIEIGDPTVKQTLATYGEGVTLSDLTVQSITYHKENPENGKHD